MRLKIVVVVVVSEAWACALLGAGDAGWSSARRIADRITADIAGPCTTAGDLPLDLLQRQTLLTRTVERRAGAARSSVCRPVSRWVQPMPQQRCLCCGMSAAELSCNLQRMVCVK